MKNALWNIAKAGIIFGIVGALLAVSSPALGSTLGAAGLISSEVVAQAATTSVAWTSAFFGAFGAISAAVTPVCERILGGGDSTTPADIKVAEKSCCDTPSVVIANTQIQPNISVEAKAKLFATAIEQERATHAPSQTRH